MNTARFEFVAERYAPRKRATEVEFQPTGYTNKLECGHVVQTAAHMYIEVGTELKCYECGRIAARKLPEFNGETK